MNRLMPILAALIAVLIVLCHATCEAACDEYCPGPVIGAGIGMAKSNTDQVYSGDTNNSFIGNVFAGYDFGKYVRVVAGYENLGEYITSTYTQYPTYVNQTTYNFQDVYVSLMLKLPLNRHFSPFVQGGGSMWYEKVTKNYYQGSMVLYTTTVHENAYVPAPFYGCGLIISFFENFGSTIEYHLYPSMGKSFMTDVSGVGATNIPDISLDVYTLSIFYKF